MHFIRPPDIHVGGLMFYRDSSFFLSFFVNYPEYPPSSLDGTQQKLVTRSEVSPIWRCMCKIWGIPSIQIGGPKTTFLTTSQLNGNFDGLYPWNET